MLTSWRLRICYCIRSSSLFSSTEVSLRVLPSLRTDASSNAHLQQSISTEHQRVARIINRIDRPAPLPSEREKQAAVKKISAPEFPAGSKVTCIPERATQFPARQAALKQRRRRAVVFRCFKSYLAERGQKEDVDESSRSRVKTLFGGLFPSLPSLVVWVKHRRYHQDALARSYRVGNHLQTSPDRQTFTINTPYLHLALAIHCIAKFPSPRMAPAATRPPPPPC